MAHKQTFKLSSKALVELQNSSKQKTAILAAEIKGQMDAVVELLRQYDHFDQTNREVFNPELEKNSVYFDTNGTGGFRIDFELHYFFGCDDLNTERERSMHITFKINYQLGIIELTGDYVPPKRDPDEY